jgi:cytoskeletal protein CcmA (bactofilin family)
MNAHDVSVLGEDTSLSGRIKGQDLMILGRFEGELTLTGRLHLGPKAQVNATVRAESVDVEGTFDGEIRAKALTFAPSAQARGLFLADRLGIREGAVVQGAFNLATQSDARPVPKADEPKAAEPPVATAPANPEASSSAAAPPAA